MTIKKPLTNPGNDYPKTTQPSHTPTPSCLAKENEAIAKAEGK
jgi:hypothetical protein